MATVATQTPKPKLPNPATRARQQYQRAQIETASPTRLIVLLYDGAIRFCTLGEEAMRAGSRETQNAHLVRAQRILGELVGSLNQEAGGEIAINLNRLYLHMLEQLVNANFQDKPESVQNVITLLRDLRETWEEVDRMTAQSATDTPRLATLGA